MTPILYMDTNSKDTYIVLVDGNCALCHGLVKWIVKNKKEDAVIRFSALQYLGWNEPISVILYRNGKFYFASDVLMELRICLELKASIWIHLLRIFPKKLRDFFYKFIARHRYRWFGKVPEKCYVEDHKIKPLWLTEDIIRNIIPVQEVSSQKGTSKPSKSSGRKG